MTVLIIDLLEAIEIEIRDGQQLSASLALQHGLMQTVGQQYAVGQSGEHVKMCEMLELPLMFLGRADIGGQRDILLCLALCVSDGTDGEQFRVQLAILASVPEFATPMADAE